MSEENELKTLAQSLKAATDDVKKHAETTTTELKNLGVVTAETKASADKALAEMNAISARLSEVEQKMARRGSDGPVERKSMGRIVVESDEVKALLASKRGTANVEVKAIISAWTDLADGSAGDLIVPDRLPGILGIPERRMTVRDLLTPGTTTSNAIQYVKETGFTNGAATVAEVPPTATRNVGNLKPQSEIQFDVATTPVTTIAHWVLATKQILDDAPMLRSYIDGRLRYGLAYAEENQLLMGGGTGTDLNGIYTQATAYVQQIAPPTNVVWNGIDILRQAILQASLAEFPPTGIVLNPIQWAAIELTRPESATGVVNNGYVFANPQGNLQPRLWGLPVVQTQAMTTDKFLVGAFKLGAQIFDRESANVEISTEDSDNFRRNLVTVRAEERLGLAVYRPQAFIKGDLGYAP